MCGHHRHHHHFVPPERTSAIPADDVRASDAEREEVVSALRVHAGEGRLTIEELEERIGRTHAARTHRDLAAIVADLPPARRARPRRDAREEFGEHLRSYLSVMALLVLVWALSGMGAFWPLWPAAIWGFFVLSHAGSVRRPRVPHVRT